MKTFLFKHQTLLFYRKNLVTEIELKLNEINTRAHWFAARLLSIQEEIDRSIEHLIAARVVGDLQKQDSITDYIQTLRHTLPEMQKAHKNECQKLLEIKKKVAEAILQRKIIENLKKRQYTAYLKQQQKQEEFQLDEFRSTRYT